MKEKKKQLIKQLKPLTRAIVEMFGPNCEALIHDVSDLEHSIVWIEGNVTHRKIGGPVTDIGLAHLKESRDKDYFHYISSTKDGRVLKSTSVLFRNKKGDPIASLCINLDITPYQTIEHVLHGITHYNTDEQHTEHFSNDINEILESLIQECEQEIGKPIASISRDEKVLMVRKMDERGAFQIKRAAPLIAKRLGVTRYTVYNYLNESRGLPAGKAAEVEESQ